MKNLVLRNGVEIPLLGLGVFRTPDGETTVNSVKWALEAGYRHIDTAKCYGNENSVGDGIIASGVKREDIFLTTKLWVDDIETGEVAQAYQHSCDLLQTEYCDLYLIHKPMPPRVDTWAKMVELYEAGKVRAIGVSNYNINHLEELENAGLMLPHVNQIESNPYFQNDELINYCKEKGILVEVYSPLGGTGGHQMEDEVLNEIAKKYNRSVAQVILEWQAQRDVVVLAKSTHQERIIQNLNSFDFVLADEDMQRINAINKNERVGGDPKMWENGKPNFPPRPAK